MHRGCAATLCLLALARASDDSTPKKACSSSLKGDYQFEACGAFCKEAKKGNHCKFCKCKACTFCAADHSAAVSSASSPPALSPSLLRNAPPPPRWPKKGKKAKTKGGDNSSAAKKAKCESELKGDLPFMACGSFCKAPKAGNHCKFCKCRTCSYCTAEGKPAAGFAVAAPVRVRETTPQFELGGASVGTPASALGSSGPPQRGVPIDTVAKTGGSHMQLIQGFGVGILLVLLGLGLVAFTSHGDATVGSWRHTLQTHLAKMGLADHGREGTRLNPEGSLSNDLDAAFREVDKLEAVIGNSR